MRIKKITSSSNPYFRTLMSLHDSKGIKKEKLILISGKKIVSEVMNQNSSIQNFIFSEKHRSLVEEMSKEHSLSQGIELSSSLFKELDILGTHFPFVLLNCPPLTSFQKSEPGLNVFLALSDPSNLGSTLRSLKAFDVSQVILLKESANPYLPKVTKSASGVNLLLPLTRGPSIQDLQTENPVALDMTGKRLQEFTWPKTTDLILGEEGQGLPSHLKKRSQLLRIEMSDEVESLSAPIAVSIACYQFYIQQPTKVLKRRD